MIRKALGAVLMATGLLGLGWLAREELRYLEPGELDLRPFPMRRVDVPNMMDEKGVQYFGKLKMRLYVRASGELDHIEVAESTLPQPVVDAAIKAFTAPGWGPGMKAGRARRGVKVVVLDYRADVTDAPFKLER